MNEKLNQLIGNLVSIIKERGEGISGMILLADKEHACISIKGSLDPLASNLLNIALKEPNFAEMLLKVVDTYLSIKEAEDEAEEAVKELIEKTLGYNK